MPHARRPSKQTAWAFVLLCGVSLGVLRAWPETDERSRVRCTVAQLTQLIAGSGSDGQIATQLAGMQLRERLDTPTLERIRAGLPGERSRQALTILADESKFLDPPPAQVDDSPTPDAAATRQMLVQIVSYVNTTLRQLPNFVVTKETSRYEDRPEDDALEATGTVSYAYQPLHFVGRAAATLTYRNHGEVTEETLGHAMKQTQGNAGMATHGEFGAVLISVVADALKGTITWARWEKSDAGRLAVFHFAVPNERSHYRVQFCCIVEGFDANGLPDQRVFNELVAYHGEIAFNPSDGSIARMMLQAEMPEHGLVPNAGIVVEYGPVEIGGKSFICPLLSVSLLQAHTTQQPNTQSRSNYRGALKTFLNDTQFRSYRRFGSEVRIVPASQ